MKNKNGFVFLESVIVLMVVALSLSLIYASYSLVTRKSASKETYDRASDKYLLYTLSNLGTTNTKNYSKILSASSSNVVKISTNSCNITSNNLGEIFKSNDDCNKALQSLNVVYLYLIKDVNDALQTPNITSTIDNGSIDYIKTLKKCYDTNCTNHINYMIGVFYRSGNYYFASIEI